MKALLIIYALVIVASIVTTLSINNYIDMRAIQSRAEVSRGSVRYLKTYNPQRTVNINTLQGGGQ